MKKPTQQMPPEKPDQGYELRVDLSDHIDSAASVSIHARTDLMIEVPEVCRVWLTTLLPDPYQRRVRLKLSIEATADTEEEARQSLALIREAFSAAIAREEAA